MKKSLTVQSKRSIGIQLGALLDGAKNIVKEIDRTNAKVEDALDDIDARVGESITAVEKIYSDLDRIERETGDEIDRLILQQAEVLAEE